ncbi:MAG: hypoxanthine phosphoribosyltransferase [Clostridia bacterium]|nr:hypoxanthine phosphoribosyltransferase [Clostridia bacterium]
MANWNDHVDHVLIDEAELREIVSRLAAQIDSDYSGEDKNPILVGVLKGSVTFMTDLMRAMKCPAQIDFMRVSSYGNSTVASGNVNIILDLNRPNLPNEDIIVVEDIVDSGRTLKYLVSYLLNKGARSVRTVTLLDKPERREVDFTPEYIGKEIPNAFVIGYGLDYAEKYRTLPYVGVIRSDKI